MSTKRKKTTPATSKPAMEAAFDRAASMRALERWYRANGRHHLPWRQTHDRYAILVSEVMLQQTQVSRVLPRWERWMGRWATPAALAEATTADVIREWSGLGYNNRAVRLREAAARCTAEHGSGIPADPAALRGLPGIGAYTAGAVLCFSGEGRTIPVDTNIGRVVARLMYGRANRAAMAPAEERSAVVSVTPTRQVRDRALALMDLGAMVCTGRTPNCDECPVRKHCRWLAAGRPPGAANTGPSPRFEETARFARGRIVAALGQGPAGTADIANLLPGEHREKAEEYLAALQRDGLVEVSEGVARLAGDVRG